MTRKSKIRTITPQAALAAITGLPAPAPGPELDTVDAAPASDTNLLGTPPLAWAEQPDFTLVHVRATAAEAWVTKHNPFCDGDTKRLHLGDEAVTTLGEGLELERHGRGEILGLYVYA